MVYMLTLVPMPIDQPGPKEIQLEQDPTSPPGDDLPVEGNKTIIRNMFDSIVPTYDLLNRMLSMGIDRGWRKSLVAMAGDSEGRVILDLCCGTGDLSKLFLSEKSKLVSLDFSLSMLHKGRAKGWLGKGVIGADVCRLPFRGESFDCLAIAFGIRNIPDIPVFMQESERVLKKGGTLLILELTRPSNRVVSFFYRFYLTRLLPVIGGIISGKGQAYRYLSRTVATFMDTEHLTSLLGKHGFVQVRVTKKTFGIASILVCRKPLED